MGFVNVMADEGMPDEIFQAILDRGRELGVCVEQQDKGMICTRPAGHNGMHIARGARDQVIDTWA